MGRCHRKRSQGGLPGAVETPYPVGLSLAAMVWGEA
jgi:hypothetical protein